MATPKRVFGPSVVLDANLAMNVTAVVNDGVSDITLSGSAGNLIAGTYPPHYWVEHGAKVLRQWLFDRLMAHASITVKPVSAASLDVAFGFPDDHLIPGMNTTLMKIHIGTLGIAATANGPARIKSLTIDNGNGWASMFGLARVDETGGSSRLITTTPPTALEADGRYQPRWLYCVRASYRDTGDQEEKAAVFSDTITGGGLSFYEFGESEFHRTIEVVAQQRDVCGPSLIVGRFSSFGATRNLLDLFATDETLLLMSGTFKRTDQLVAGAYLRVGRTNYPVRFRQVSSNTYVAFEKVISTAFPAVFNEVQVISELHALTLEWARAKGMLWVYEVIESSGQSSWIAKCYGPKVAGAWPIPHERVGRIPIFTMRFDLKLNSAPAISAP